MDEENVPPSHPVVNPTNIPPTTTKLNLTSPSAREACQQFHLNKNMQSTHFQFFDQKLQTQHELFKNYENQIITSKSNFNLEKFMQVQKSTLFKKASYFETSEPQKITPEMLPLYCPEILDENEFEVADCLIFLGKNRYLLCHLEVVVECGLLRELIEIEHFRQREKCKKIYNYGLDKNTRTTTTDKLLMIDFSNFIVEDSDLSLFIKIISFLYTNFIKIEPNTIRTLYSASNLLKSKRLDFIINYQKYSKLKEERTPENIDQIYANLLVKKRVNFKCFRDKFPDNLETCPILKYFQRKKLKLQEMYEPIPQPEDELEEDENSSAKNQDNKSNHQDMEDEEEDDEINLSISSEPSGFSDFDHDILKTEIEQVEYFDDDEKFQILVDTVDDFLNTD